MITATTIKARFPRLYTDSLRHYVEATWYTRDQRYKIQAWSHGEEILLMRGSDCATVRFEGAAASQFLSELDAVDGTFDGENDVCSEYEHMMTGSVAGDPD